MQGVKHVDSFILIGEQLDSARFCSNQIMAELLFVRSDFFFVADPRLVCLVQPKFPSHKFCFSLIIIISSIKQILF